MKIDVLQIVEKKDGTKEIVFDYDEEFLEYVKIKTGKKRPSKKEISEIFLETLEKGLDLQKESKSDEK